MCYVCDTTCISYVGVERRKSYGGGGRRGVFFYFSFYFESKFCIPAPRPGFYSRSVYSVLDSDWSSKTSRLSVRSILKKKKICLDYYLIDKAYS